MTEQLMEVTDFGFDLEKKNIDGFCKCSKCGEETHFVILQKKIQEVIDRIMERK